MRETGGARGAEGPRENQASSGERGEDGTHAAGRAAPSTAGVSGAMAGRGSEGDDWLQNWGPGSAGAQDDAAARVGGMAETHKARTSAPNPVARARATRQGNSLDRGVTTSVDTPLRLTDSPGESINQLRAAGACGSPSLAALSAPEIRHDIADLLLAELPDAVKPVE